MVNVLLSFNKRQKGTSLYKLVQSFCRIYLPHGYEYKSWNREEIVIKENNSNRRHRSKSLGNDKKGVNFISGKIDTFFFKNNKTWTK